MRTMLADSTNQAVFIRSDIGGQPDAEHACAGRSPRILLAEDNDELRVLGAYLLESAGYDVIACADGSLALKALKSIAEFDLIVSDIEMPGASGIEVARTAAALRPLLPVILTSGALLPSMIHAQMDAAGWTFIPKPSPLTKMLTAVHERLCAARRVSSPSSA